MEFEHSHFEVNKSCQKETLFNLQKQQKDLLSQKYTLEACMKNQVRGISPSLQPRLYGTFVGLGNN